MPRVALVAIVGLVALVFTFAASMTTVQARTFHHSRTFLFRDVTIGPDDVVNGDLNVIFGNATVLGTVRGDLNVVGGSCDTGGGNVEGEVNCMQSTSLHALAPWVASYVGALPLAEQTNRLMVKLAINLVVFLMFLLFPLRMRVTLARVEAHPGLAAIVGMLAFVAIVPVGLLLLLSIVGIPLIVLEVAAVFLGVWIGQGAIALLVGRRLSELARPNATPSPLTALILGLVVISAAEIVPIVGWAVTALICLIGLGAAILGFIREPAIPVMSARAPIGGPPMTN
ncbi:MAG: hypothetical protein JOY59_00080 [Candidatus Eremiobacteraeota bacterium]|nr:hypothetical protein [Candidatus Eremiobacteraeota bacterium]